MSETKKIRFEDNLAKLEQIVAKLEDDDTGLEESISLYSEALNLSKELQKQLQVFEAKINELDQQK